VLLLQILLAGCICFEQNIEQQQMREEIQQKRDSPPSQNGKPPPPARNEAQYNENTEQQALNEQLFKTVGLPVAATAFAFVLKEMASCRCVQSHALREHKWCLEKLGYAIMGVATLGVIALSGSIYGGTREDQSDEVETLFAYTLPVSLALAWGAYQPLALSVVFVLKRAIEMKLAKNKSTQQHTEVMKKGVSVLAVASDVATVGSVGVTTSAV